MSGYGKVLEPKVKDLICGDAIVLAKGQSPMRQVTMVWSDRHDIPILVWEWEPVGFIYIEKGKEPEGMTPELLEQLEFSPQDCYGNPTGHWSGYCVWKDREVAAVSLMNFRRYGWATAPGFAPEHGWAGPDAIWPNKACGPVPCSTVEEVVVASLASVIERAAKHWGIPGDLVEHVTVRPLYRELVDNALESQAVQWAGRAVNDDNGALSQWDVVIGRVQANTKDASAEVSEQVAVGR